MKMRSCARLAAVAVVLSFGVPLGCSGPQPGGNGQPSEQQHAGGAPALQPTAADATAPPPNTAAHAPPAVVPPAVTPPRLPQEPTTVSLPGPVEDVLVGGAGHYLILDLRALQKLAVFDVSEGKIAGYITLEGGAESVAANADKLLVVDRKTRFAKRYALADLRQEAVQQIPGDIPIMAVGMGAATHGPLFVACSDSTRHEILAYDPATMEPIEYKTKLRGKQYIILNEDMRLSVSSDGAVIGGWSHRFQPSGTLVVCTAGDQMEYSYQHVSAGYVCPDDVGERIYTANGLLDARGQKIEDDDPATQNGVLAVPAIGGPYYLTVPSGERTFVPSRVTNHVRMGPTVINPPPLGNRVISVYLEGQAAPVATLPYGDFRLPRDLRRLTETAPALCRRLFFIPAAHLIVELAEPANTLVLHPLDIDEQLKRCALDEPIVVSRPPKMVRVGETVRYQVDAKTKSGNPAYQLESAPPGMVLSDSGLLLWTPSARPDSGMASAVIAVTDSGRTKRHAVVLYVQPPAAVTVAADQGAPPSMPLPAPGTAPAASPTAPSASKPVGDVRLKLPSTYSDVCAGGGGQFLVLRLDMLQKLAVLDVFAAKIVGYVPVTGKCLFAAGATKLVVVYPEKLVLQRFDLETQKLETTRPLPSDGPVSLLAMGAASQGPVLLSAAHNRFSTQALLLDLDTLQPLDYRMPQQYGVELHGGSQVRASADGRVFGAWRTSGSPSGVGLLVFNGREVATFYEHNTRGWVVPNETGDRVYTARGTFTNQLKPVSDGLDSGPAVPAVQGPFFVRVSTSSEPRSGRHRAGSGPQPGTSLGVYVVDEAQPLVTLHNVALRDSEYGDQFARDRVSLDKRIYLVPSGNVLATLPDGQDSVAGQTHTKLLSGQGLATGTPDSSRPFGDAWRHFLCHQPA